MKYRVLIADDHLLVRMGIKSLIAHLNDYEVVAEAEDGGAALACLRDQRADIALLDIAMPEITGIEAALQTRQFDQAVKIIFLSANDTPEVVEQALDAGANGYLLKDFVLCELEAALAAVIRGEHYLSPRLNSGLNVYRNAQAAAKPALTPRQMEILRLIAGGASGKVIARQLGISPKTVEFHRAQIMDRLGLRDIASLTLYASSHGLLPPKR